MECVKDALCWVSQVCSHWLGGGAKPAAARGGCGERAVLVQPCCGGVRQ